VNTPDADGGDASSQATDKGEAEKFIHECSIHCTALATLDRLHEPRWYGAPSLNFDQEALGNRAIALLPRF